jgi:hypothetical protein
MTLCARFLCIVAVVGANALLAAGCGGGESTATATAAAAGTATTTGDVTSTRGQDEATANRPFVVYGRGPTRRSIDVPADYAPVILGARYPEGSFLIVQIRGEGLQRLEGHRGAFVFDAPSTSVIAMPGIESGQYELVVEGTKGRWTLQFSAPDRDAPAYPLIGRPIAGEHDTVGTVHLDRARELQWEMQTNGAFFSAELLGYGDAEGSRQFLGMLQGGLAFEPGRRGFRSAGVMPTGDYLLIVDADGEWVVSFTAAE